MCGCGSLVAIECARMKLAAAGEVLQPCECACHKRGEFESAPPIVGRALVIPLPRVRCIGCREGGDPTFHHITHGGSMPLGCEVSVYLGPPAGWTRLDPDLNDIRDRQGSPRRFMICPSCYALGLEHGQRSVAAAVEMRRPEGSA